MYGVPETDGEGHGDGDADGEQLRSGRVSGQGHWLHVTVTLRHKESSYKILTVCSHVSGFETLEKS